MKVQFFFYKTYFFYSVFFGTSALCCENNHRGSNDNRVEPHIGEDKRDEGERGECGEEEAVVDGATEEEDNRAAMEEEIHAAKMARKTVRGENARRPCD